MRARPIAVVALLGFSSGLPLHLTGQTLMAWMLDVGVDLTTIGAFALVALPYTFKWAWAPLLDRYRLPFLGRRRGWIALLHLLLIAAIVAMGSIDARAAPVALAMLAVAVAFLSASLDVVVGAFTADALAPEERATGSALYVAGYRLAMIVGGAVALLLAGRVAWQVIYGGVAAMMLVGVAAIVAADEPPDGGGAPRSLAAAIGRPFARLLAQRGIAVVLAFVALYRLCDFFATRFVIAYLDVDFTFAEISMLYYLVGLAGTVAGGLLGAAWLRRFGMRRALVGFGLAQAATNLAWLGLDGRLEVLALVVVLDNLAASMAGATFVAFLMSRCEPAVSATQYAVLTSLSSVGAHLLAFAAAALIEAEGWTVFWAGTAALVIPAIALVRYLPDDVR